MVNENYKDLDRKAREFKQLRQYLKFVYTIACNITPEENESPVNVADHCAKENRGHPW